MRFVPYGELGERPNLIADGPPTPSTVLTLSHWPFSPTPAALAQDLSAQIAFRYLDHPDRWPSAELVSNDHLDQDGLVSVFTLVSPQRALLDHGYLCEVAEAGDFATFSDIRPAWSSFALATLADAERSPLGRDFFAPDYGERCAALYAELLERLPELVAKPESFRALWEEEDASYQATQASLHSGRIVLEEVRALDLAVVVVPDTARCRLATRFMSRADRPWHPAALYNATTCSRVLVVQGQCYELRFRYETWVKLVTRKPLRRVDLTGLVRQLDEEESAGARWLFEGVSATEPALRLSRGEQSSIAPDRFRSLVERYLAVSSPAWEPWG